MRKVDNKFYCDNCGKLIGRVDYSSNTFGQPPSNAAIYRKGGFLGFFVLEYGFCADKCKREWRTNNK